MFFLFSEKALLPSVGVRHEDRGAKGPALTFSLSLVLSWGEKCDSYFHECPNPKGCSATRSCLFSFPVGGAGRLSAHQLCVMYTLFVWQNPTR